MQELIEQFAPVPRYEGIYEVSNYGYVRRVKTGRILIFDKNRKRYLRVCLYKNAKRRRLMIHRLVLRVFKPTKGYTLLEENHLDGNKKNNREDNLEWNTKSENNLHRHHVLGKNNWRPIIIDGD